MWSDTIDSLMGRMPPPWRYRWCESNACACLGCANRSGGLTRDGFSKADWSKWTARNPNKKSDCEWGKLEYNSSKPDFRQLCQELVDDLDSWMEFDEQPSMLWQEYEKSMNLIRKVRRALKETQND